MTSLSNTPAFLHGHNPSSAGSGWPQPWGRPVVFLGPQLVDFPHYLPDPRKQKTLWPGSRRKVETWMRKDVDTNRSEKKQVTNNNTTHTPSSLSWRLLPYRLTRRLHREHLFCSRYYSRFSTNVNSIASTSYELGSLVTRTLQMKIWGTQKLRVIYDWPSW